MVQSVDSISIIRSTEGYLLQLEDDDGEMREFALSVDQLEIMAEEIERHLLIDEEDALVLEEEASEKNGLD